MSGMLVARMIVTINHPRRCYLSCWNFVSILFVVYVINSTRFRHHHNVVGSWIGSRPRYP